MKILITGVAGFIGSHTAERFKELGFSVIGIDNFNDCYDVNLKLLNARTLKDKGVDVIKLDIRSSDLKSYLINDFDYIFHFAAQTGLSSSSTFEDYFSNNILGTKNLIDFALSCPQLKLFVNIGTSSIYGLNATASEEAVPKPASYYGVTKLAAEQLVLQKYREGKFKACSLRLYSVIGPRERPEKLYTKLITCGLNSNPFPLFRDSEKHFRSFTYVGDSVDGIVGVIGKENMVNGEIINIGAEVEHSTQQGIEAVESVLGKSIKIEIIEKRLGDQLRTKANINKAKKLLNYNPQTTLLEAVKQQVDWYKANFVN